MNKDQVKGRVREATGEAQEQLGKAINSPKHEAKGHAKEQAGKVQKNWGDAKDEVRQSAEDMKPRK
jgi:uncharacterized protein YjbJ (UPF0337 family)